MYPQQNELTLKITASKVEQNALLLAVNAVSERGSDIGYVSCKWNTMTNHLEMNRLGETEWLLTNNVCQAIGRFLIENVSSLFVVNALLVNDSLQILNLENRTLPASYKYTHHVDAIHVTCTRSRPRYMIDDYFRKMSRTVLECDIIRKHY